MKVTPTLSRLASMPLVIFLAGCAAQAAAPAASPAPELTPYFTRTPFSAPSGTIPPSQTPAPTPTPAIYTIARNDTLSAIAKKFGITVEALLAANPGMIPQALAVGQTITIPPASQAAGQSLLASPEPANLGPIYCQPTGGGTACFVAVHNPYAEALEFIGLQVNLFDSSGGALGSQQTSLALNILPAGATLPAEAYFSGVTNGTSATAQLTSAVRLSTNSDRIIETDIQNLLTAIAWNGLSARLEGKVFLPESEKPATSLWLAAIAYDVSGRIVAYRRLEWSDTLQPGTSRPFGFTVYSLGPGIQRVELLAEAHP